MFKKFSQLCYLVWQSWSMSVNEYGTLLDSGDVDGLLQKLDQEGPLGAWSRVDEQRGQTLLMRACEAGEVQVVEKLLSLGADPNDFPEKTWRPALQEAAKNGHTDCVKALLKAGVDVNQWRVNDITPLRELSRTALMEAAKQGSLEIVRLLVDNGADLNRKDIQERTALMEACHHRHPSIVLYLMEKGADYQMNDSWSFFIQDMKKNDLPLLKAIQQAHEAKIKPSTLMNKKNIIKPVKGLLRPKT